MVTGLAFAATAVATLFAEATLVRFTQRRSAHLLAWTIALAMFALASAFLAVGTSTGWDRAEQEEDAERDAVLNVPWLALGTVALLLGPEVARRARWFLVFFSGIGVGVLLSAPMDPVHGTAIPVGKDVFGAFPRALAGIGSGIGATVIIGGAVWSAVRFARSRNEAGQARLAAANVLIAAGTLVLSSGGLVQGIVGHDEAFSVTLAIGITVVYGGFLVAEGQRSSRRTSLPDVARGISSTTS